MIKGEYEYPGKWFIGFCCLIGEENRDYWLMETDPNWWTIYLWIKRN